MTTGQNKRGSFWRSPAGVAFGVFLAVAILFLVLEHNAHLLGAWPLLFLIVCVGMHFFMHRGHGGHGLHMPDDQSKHRKDVADER